jgi:hypothetical protein
LSKAIEQRYKDFSFLAVLELNIRRGGELVGSGGVLSRSLRRPLDGQIIEAAKIAHTATVTLPFQATQSRSCRSCRDGGCHCSRIHGPAFCKKIVERYGGRIWLASEAIKGATFFTLPNDNLSCKPSIRVPVGERRANLQKPGRALLYNSKLSRRPMEQPASYVDGDVVRETRLGRKKERLENVYAGDSAGSGTLTL